MVDSRAYAHKNKIIEVKKPCISKAAERVPKTEDSNKGQGSN